MKNNPKYVRSPKQSYPLRQILHEFDTLFTLRTFSAQLWKNFFTRFLDEPDTPLTFKCPPGIRKNGHSYGDS